MIAVYHEDWQKLYDNYGPYKNNYEEFEYHVGMLNNDFRITNNQFFNDKKNVNNKADAHQIIVNYSNIYFLEFQLSKSKTCKKCNSDFVSSNRFYRYLKICRANSKIVIFSLNKQTLSKTLVNKKLINENEIQNENEITTFFVDIDYFIIEFIVEQVVNTGLAFRKWYYVELSVSFFKRGVITIICVNFECTISLIDKVFLREVLFDIYVKKTKLPVTIRGVKSVLYFINDYCLLDLYIPKIFNSKKTIDYIRREIYIVDDLKTKMFIKIDILELKRMQIDIGDEKFFIRNCNDLIANIIVKVKNDVGIRRAIRSQKKIIILSNSFVRIFVKMRISLLLSDRDYFFEFNLKKVYVHIVDINILFVCIKNDIKSKKMISRYINLKTVVEYNVDSYYIVHLEYHLYIAEKNDIKVNKSKRVSDIKFLNDIFIFDDKGQVVKLKILIEKYSDIWEDIGEIVDISFENHIKINFNINWNSSTASKFVQKIYFFDELNREAIDKKFDKLHVQNKMKWTTEFISFSWLIFVIWKTVYEGLEKVSKRKLRVVVDIRDLNKIVIIDSYLLPLQIDVIDMLLSMENINIFNDVFFFLQFDVWLSNWYKQIVASHRGLEYFKVIAINYKESLSYMQRIMNKELRSYKDFVKIYIDDLVVFSSIFEMHFIHLRKLFQLLLKLKMIINLKKTFFNYSNITLFD